MNREIVLQFSTAGPSSLRPFSKGWKNRYSKIIRMLGHSYFSHVDFVLDMDTVGKWLSMDPHELRAKYGDHALLGASQNPDSPPIVGSPVGVAIRVPEYQSFGIRRRVIIRTDRADAILAFARKQIGRPFDVSALSPRVFLSDPFYGDVESRDWRHPDKWFCAEYAACSFEDGAYWGKGEKCPIKKNRITPTDFHLILLMDPHVMNRSTMFDPVPTLRMGRYEK